MKTLILNFFGAFMLFGLNSCTTNPETVADKTLVDTEWDLQSFVVIGVGESDIGSQGMILKFTKDARVEGEAYRIYGDPDVHGNSYDSTYEVGNDGSLHIDLVASTKVGTPPGSRYWEYLDALHKSSSYEILEGNMLRIFYDGKTKALYFKSE